MQSVSGDGTAGAKINLAQVKIGGETAGGLSIDAERRSGITHFNTFKASLPGGSRLDLTGDLKDDEGKLSFAGNAFIGGTSLGRLRSWADKSGMAIDVQADGPFSAGGKVDIDATRFALADASGEISGRSLAGDLTITHDERERTEVTLQASELDTRDVFPKTTGALQAELRKALGLVPPDNQKPDDTLPGDMRLRVVAGSLTDGSETYRDVDVTFELEGSEIRLPAARLTTANGLAIGLEGGIKTGDGRPVGTLAYDLVGKTPDAMKDLARKFGLAGIVGEERFKGVKEGKLAGLLRLGLRTPLAIDVTFDGTLNGARLSGSGEFDGGLSEWRSRPSRVQAAFNTLSLPVLLTALGRDPPATAGATASPAQALIVAMGTVGSGAETRVEVTSQGLAMTFTGRTTWPEDSGLALKGAVDLKAGDFADALSVAGITLPTGSAGIATHGTLDLSREKGVWTVATRNLALGTSTLSGEVKVAANAAGAQQIEGKIGADRLPVGSLLSALIDRSSAPQVVAGAAPSAENVAMLETRSIWPDGLFNFDAIGRTEANIQLRFQSLDLSGNLATRDGAFQLGLTPGKLTVSNLAADAAGGKLTGEMNLEKALGGVSLTTKLRLDQAKLASLSPVAKGFVSVAFDADARAQSPAGLIAVMTGSGSVKLAGAEIPGPAAAALQGVVDTVLHGKLQNDPRALAASLTTTLNTSKLNIGNRDFTMKVADGSVRFDTVALNAPEGKVEATTTADLTSLNFNAACQLTAMVRPLPPPPVPLPGWTPPPPKAPLPPAIVLYNGQLDNLANVKTNVDVSDLQRELVVRQMERNVEELELSRRVDEERARLEKERRKAAEEQRAAAIAAARAQKQAERLPPVIPESAGTANPVAAPVTNPAATSPPPAVSPDAQPTPVPTQPQPGPQAEEQPQPKPGDGANTVLTPKILIEPIPPPPGGSTQGDAAGQVPVIDPQTGLPVVPKDQPAVRPTTARSQRPDQSRRTSSDEVMRALGGYP
jgi:hypothetical protein